jgi:hypothetical protein
MAGRSGDRDHPSRRHWNELLIFFQSALIRIAETWNVLRKDPWTAQGLPETSAVLAAALRWDCRPLAFFWPGRPKPGDMALKQPHHLSGTRKQND